MMGTEDEFKGTESRTTHLERSKAATMTPFPFTNYTGVADEELQALARVVQNHHRLDDIFTWGRSQSPPVYPAEVVKQDEFTHDVLVPLHGGRYLVYGIT
jgi:hypothetical protein